jgi:hypothetical protein
VRHADTQAVEVGRRRILRFEVLARRLRLTGEKQRNQRWQNQTHVYPSERTEMSVRDPEGIVNAQKPDARCAR